MMHKAWCSMEEVPCCFSRSSVNFKVAPDKKITHFEPNWAFPDCYSNLNSPTALKWCTKLDLVKKKGPIVFQGHLSNFKVTREKKSLNLTRIEYFRTVTPVWIHWWIWNDAQKCSVEEVPYWLSRSSIKFQGHTGWKIDAWIQFE